MLSLPQGKMVALFGVPDMGKVCSEKHLPDFLENVSIFYCEIRCVCMPAS